jgi:hypothetical protein
MFQEFGVGGRERVTLDRQRVLVRGGNLTQCKRTVALIAVTSWGTSGTSWPNVCAISMPDSAHSIVILGIGPSVSFANHGGEPVESVPGRERFGGLLLSLQCEPARRHDEFNYHTFSLVGILSSTNVSVANLYER